MPAQILDLTPYYGIISVSGPEAMSFLQGQLTCDIREVSDQSLQLGGFSSQKGRLRALFKLFKKNQDFYLTLPKPLIPLMMVQLKKAAIFSKVTIQEELHLQLLGWIGQ